MEIHTNTNIRHIVNFINKTTWDNRKDIIKILYKLFKKSKTKIIYDNTNYITLTSNEKFNKKDMYYNYKINRQSNGILLKVYEDNGYKIKLIVIPPENLVPSTDLDILNEKFDREHHKAFEVIDGTMFHMYYDNRWMISTSRLRNVELDNITSPINEPILSDLFKILDIEDLNREHAYSFTFRHPDLHRTADKPEIFLHQTTVDQKIIRDVDIGIPNITPIQIDYDEIVNIVSSPLDKIPEKHKYGIILRNGRGKYSNIFIESKVNAFIRSIFYEDMYNKNFEDELEKRYRSNKHKLIIRELLPLWNHVFEKVDVDTEKVIIDLLGYFIDGEPTKYPKLAKTLKFELDLTGTPKDKEVFEKVLRNVINNNNYPLTF